ncbi:hypothetical protein HNP82_000068 [Catenibacillus scindens]|uniref:DUF2194 domain-containing protein n=1 Tax=Catenibacillus scindens TaxID=673271 RepID=A0A7W8M3N5_9FIRM|nr:DUF2194 domain-containing protein [Catenibacillus scindens]MBB5262974.1 hypothetical protein [Catenibacillus scindens]
MKKKDKKLQRWKAFHYKGLVGIFCVFAGIGVILFAERSGIRYSSAQISSAYIPVDESLAAREVYETVDKDCLVLMDSENASSMLAVEQFQRILLDMKVGYEMVDVQSGQSWDYDDYETLVVLMSDLSLLGEEVLAMADWVEDGGSALFALTLQKEPYEMLIEQKLGIISSGYDNVLVDSICPSEDFMIGGGVSYTITDPFDSAWAVELGDRAVVHATNGDGRVPLIWETKYGDGKFVVDNFGLYERAVRGFYAASYSLLTDCVIYPVINGSAFYLDDFPSPVPGGNGAYVTRDYGMSIADFYSNVWWPDILNLADRYGVRFTGVIIETYEDDTSGQVSRTQDISRFQYFGNMLLHQQGEIGYHGYNHQPLALDNIDYGDILPYNTWESWQAMENSVEELIEFGEAVFPGTEKTVYVPPSNVLTAEGRQMLAEAFPQIRTIASNYFSDDFVYQQEFEVAEDGIVEQPRIISGCLIDDFMKLSAVSELNMHFVNNHFMHPDDLLDEDRGAALGWETLKGNLADYMDWLYTSAPSLRNLTGSQLSGAIQRFAAVTVDKTVTEDEIIFNVDHLYDSAWFFVRFNEGTPGSVSGGELARLTGNLYLLRADEAKVTVEMSR